MATNKDRMGDKLKDREKAEEDRYFAEQDREKLEALKKDEQAVGATGLCPKCGVALDEIERNTVKVDICKSCGGVWLDKGELEELAKRESEGALTKWIRGVLEG